MVRAGELSMMRETSPGCSRGNNVLTAHFGLGQNLEWIGSETQEENEVLK